MKTGVATRPSRLTRKLRRHRCRRLPAGAFRVRIAPAAGVATAVMDTEFREPYPQTMGRTSESYRYIVRADGLRSGNAIVAGTRIGVHDVIGLLQNGESIESLRENCFPQISKAQVYECLAYYEDHQGEVDVLSARQMSLDPK
jgi:uncharacterized protein (DUF433 family)